MIHSLPDCSLTYSYSGCCCEQMEALGGLSTPAGDGDGDGDSKMLPQLSAADAMMSALQSAVPINTARSTKLAIRSVSNVDQLMRDLSIQDSLVGTTMAVLRVAFYYSFKKCAPFTKRKMRVPPGVHRRPHKELRDKCTFCIGTGLNCPLCLTLATLLNGLSMAGIVYNATGLVSNLSGTDADRIERELVELVYGSYKAPRGSATASATSRPGARSRERSRSGSRSASRTPKGSGKVRRGAAAAAVRRTTPLKGGRFVVDAAFVGLPSVESIHGPVRSDSAALESTMVARTEANLAAAFLEVAPDITQEIKAASHLALARKMIDEKIAGGAVEYEKQVAIQMARFQNATHLLPPGAKRKPLLNADAPVAQTATALATSVQTPVASSSTAADVKMAHPAADASCSAESPDLLLVPRASVRKRLANGSASSAAPMTDLELKLLISELSHPIPQRIDPHALRALADAKGARWPEDPSFVTNCINDWYNDRAKELVNRGITVKAVAPLTPKSRPFRRPDEDSEIQARYQSLKEKTQNTFAAYFLLSESLATLAQTKRDDWFPYVAHLCGFAKDKKSKSTSQTYMAMKNLGDCILIAPRLKYLSADQCKESFIRHSTVLTHLYTALVRLRLDDPARFALLWSDPPNKNAAAAVSPSAATAAS